MLQWTASGGPTKSVKVPGRPYPYFTPVIKCTNAGSATYAKVGAQREVTQRLKAVSGSTQMVEDGDLNISQLSERLDIVAEEILAGRCQVADPWRYMSNIAKRILQTRGCPLDCACGFTWHDVAFRCQGAPVVAARWKWLCKVRFASGLCGILTPKLVPHRIAMALRSSDDTAAGKGQGVTIS